MSAVTALTRGDLSQHPRAVAPILLGALLVSELGPRVVIRITEVEAYGGIGEDPGSHAHRRRTQRNTAMFGPPGCAYVYFTYGMHWCLNVVAHGHGEAGAVLIRAGEVVEGLLTAKARRPAARSIRDLARGPARLAAALGVTGAQDGVDLFDPRSPVRLAANPQGAPLAMPVCSGPRTGVAGDGATIPWRFWLPAEPTVSPHRPATRRG
ncbi:MAG: DNA-3-methyladenine glycosylase [Candidatus Nanopelagicales bacterium]